MHEIEAAIRARLDEFCTTDWCAEDGKNALEAVLKLHVAEEVSYIDRHGNEKHGSVCETCGDYGQTPGDLWPCPTVLAIAEGLERRRSE